MTSRHRALIAAVLIAGTGVLAGCGSGEEASDKAADAVAEKALEAAAEESSGGDVDIDVDDEQVTIEGEDGTYTMGGTERPESLPDDFPLAEGEITYAMESPSGSMVTVKVDDVGSAFDQALADLEAAGWTRSSVTEAEDGAMATLTGESEGDSVLITTSPTAQEISYVVTIL